MTSEEIQQQFHELQMRQIEAGLQNEQLRSQLEACKDLDKKAGQRDALANSLMENIPDIVFIKDTQGVYIACNLEFARHVGRRIKDVIGKTDFDLYKREDADFFRKNDQLMLEQGSYRQNEEWISYPDGRKILLDTMKTPYKDSDGSVIGVIAICRDITRRYHAEKELFKNKNLLEGIIDGIPDVLAIQLPDHTIERYNKAGYDMLDMTPEEVVGRKCYELIGRDRECDGCPTRKALQSGKMEKTEKYVPELGAYFDCCSNPVLDEEGNVVHIIEQLKDITILKEQERKLRESEERLDLAMMVKNEGIWDWNLASNETVFDDRFYTMAGYAPNEFPQHFTTWRELVHPADLPNADAAIKACLSGESERYDSEFRFRHRDGSWIWIRGQGKVVERDENVTPLRMVGTHTDITDRKQAEEALRKSENYYRTIFETSGSAMFIIEQDTTISHVNSNFEKLSGYSRDEIEWKKSWIEFVHSDDVERMEKNHYARRRDPRTAPPSYEFRFFTRNGELRQGYLAVNMIPDTTQSVVSLIDITERKRAEILLRESEAKLQTIIEAAEGFISTHNRQLRIEFMSRRVKDKIGRDATGDFCYKALWGFESPCPWCRSDSVFNGNTERLEYQNPETGCWYYTIMSPIFDESGRVSSIEALTIDITERKREEIALAERAAYLDKENIRLKSSMKERFRFGDIIGKSPAMQTVYETILKAAATDSSVVIFGETGTGKELVARAIHDNSDRRDAPFVAVNCGAIPDTLIESEFFGYEKGAFTGAQRDKKGFLAMADGGTLFLDEIGEIGHGMQVKLLRVIEGYGYTPVGANIPVYPEIRLITATHRDLRELVKTGAMREDFFYRIEVVPIHIPPLRERREDLPLLIEHLLLDHSHKEDLAPLSGEVLNAIQNYDWPGNVRELKNVLDRYYTLGTFYSSHSLTKIPQPKPAESPVDLREALGRYEKNLILSALENSKWRRGRAAGRLGITRRTLYKKMKMYRID